MHRPLVLGTRGSPLAMAQARMVAAALEKSAGLAPGAVEIRPVKTSGDVIRDRPLASIGGKALWTRELDRALVEGEVDFCVHSLKDVETVRPSAIAIAAVLPRDDMRERLIGASAIGAIPDQATVGTSSPRRKAQLLALRPDLRVVPIRGNVETRIRKVADKEVDATFLSSAGLDRLGIEKVGSPIAVDEMLPAPTQAVIAVECRSDDAAMAELLSAFDDRLTHQLILAERLFARTLGGTCHSPVAALATAEDGQIRLRAQILSEDGRDQLTDEALFAQGDSDAPADLARRMLALAPERIRLLFDGA